MINSIEIKNFLSHKKTKLDFSPGVNIIVGPTDSGKSAIVRALRWAITNRPTGDSFRSYWGGNTEVQILMDEGVVSRSKSEKENLYELDGAPFKAFGASVPDEIRKVLNVDETNVQTQFESHFLLSTSAGEVATHFNKVAHLDKIDTGLQNIQRWLRKLQAQVMYNESQIEELTVQVTEYDSLVEIENLIIQIEQKEERYKTLVQQMHTILDIQDSITAKDKDMKRLEIIASKGLLVEKVLVLINKGKGVAARIESLDRTYTDLSKTERDINELEEVIPMEKVVLRVLEIDTVIKEIGFQAFMGLISSIQLTDKEYKIEKEYLDKIETQFHEQMDVCPLCETVLK